MGKSRCCSPSPLLIIFPLKMQPWEAASDLHGNHSFWKKTLKWVKIKNLITREEGCIISNGVSTAGTPDWKKKEEESARWGHKVNQKALKVAFKVQVNFDIFWFFYCLWHVSQLFLSISDIIFWCLFVDEKVLWCFIFCVLSGLKIMISSQFFTP